MPSLSPEQRYQQFLELPQLGCACAAKAHLVRRSALLSPFYGGGVADPEGALRQGERPFSLSFFTPASNVIERLFPPGLSELRPVRTFTLIAAGARARRSDPAETRQSGSSAISLHAQYPSGTQVHPKNNLAWTWSAAEANQAMVAGDKAGAHRQESTRSNNARYNQRFSCCPAGPRPPP